jgi:hypothetical protein
VREAGEAVDPGPGLNPGALRMPSSKMRSSAILSLLVGAGLLVVGPWLLVARRTARIEAFCGAIRLGEERSAVDARARRSGLDVSQWEWRGSGQRSFELEIGEEPLLTLFPYCCVRGHNSQVDDRSMCSSG